MAHWDRFVQQLTMPPATSYINNPTCGCAHLPKPAIILRVPRRIVPLLRWLRVPTLN